MEQLNLFDEFLGHPVQQEDPCNINEVRIETKQKRFSRGETLFYSSGYTGNNTVKVVYVKAYDHKGRTSLVRYNKQAIVVRTCELQQIC